MKLFFFLLLGLLPHCIGFSQTETLPINITLKLEKKYEKKISRTEPWVDRLIEQENLIVKTDYILIHYYDIAIEIKNTSNQDIHLWMMTCSWFDNFEINNDYIYYDFPGCDANFSILNSIKANETVTFKATLFKDIKFDYPCQYCVYGPQVALTKVGLIIIDDLYQPSSGILDYTINMEDKSKHKIVWSNGINLLGAQPKYKATPSK